MTFLWLLGCCYAVGLDLPQHPYQDVFVNGTILAKGKGPDCASRYEAIKQVLNLYKRPITILDIGAAEGYFSFRAAYDYDASVIMIGDPEWNGNILEKLCFANTDLTNIVLLSKKISPSELEKLGECEHFDVILALNVVHHFGKEWKRGYHAILKLGDNIIIETPPNGDKGACGQLFIESINKCIDKEPYVLLGQFKRHTDQNQIDRLVWISKQKTDLTRKAYIFKPRDSIHTFKINSTFYNKSIKKYFQGRLESEKQWIPGINLITFKCLNGRYPTKEILIDHLRDIILVPSTDWFPHNVIINGQSLHLIDTDDPYHAGTDTWRFNDSLYEIMLKVISATSEQEIMEMYKTSHDLIPGLQFDSYLIR